MTRRFGRRAALGLGGLVVAGATLGACGKKNGTQSSGEAPSPSMDASEPAVTNGDEALARLKAGNMRFSGGGVRHPDESKARRSDLATGQKPFALILSCVDSRVPPELVFDQGLGDLFVARSAGQVLDHAVRGSVEYGIAELKIPLLVVLGHEKCGAVKATVEATEKNSPPMGNDIDALVTAIKPAVEMAEEEKAPDPLDAAVRYNVANIVTKLGTDSVIAAAVSGGKLKVVGARYGLATGVVEFL
jgi:carbonic anhydrase